MSDNLVDEKNGGEESFAELFESYDAGMKEDLQVGDKVKGEIISVGMDTVFVNTGTKIDGAVDRSELLDESGELPYKEGDTLELYVVAFTENEIRLSKALSGIGGLNLLRDAYAGKVPVEGTVREQCKGGFRVEVMKRLAFCPVSQIDIRYVETPEEYVGQTYQFLISKFEAKGRNIVVSRRDLLKQEQEETVRAFLETLEVGTVLEGRVANIMPYGAFVELTPGLEGMVHVSEMSWSRVEKPETVVSRDDRVSVKVIGIEEGKKKGQMKISLSMKQVTGDPWDQEDFSFRAGDKVKGKVTRLMGFGAFVEIEPGIEGLVHISEMSYTKRVHRPEDVVKADETVDVMVKEIDTENRRISLSLREAEGDPWIGVEEKYGVGSRVEGTIEKKERFGYFVNLEPGITGLLPKSKISKSENVAAIEKLQAGDTMTVLVEEIDTDARKITLGPGDAKEEGEWRQYSKADSSLGSLGEKLQEAMKKK